MIKDSYMAHKRRNTQSTHDILTLLMLYSCQKEQWILRLTYKVDRILQNVQCQDRVAQCHLSKTAWTSVLASHALLLPGFCRPCWQLFSTLKDSQDLIDFFFTLKVSMVPKTKTSICNTDLFLEIWLYWISNTSQVAEVQKGAKFVERKSLQSNLVKGKIGCELHRMEKT